MTNSRNHGFDLYSSGSARKGEASFPHDEMTLIMKLKDIACLRIRVGGVKLFINMLAPFLFNKPNGHYSPQGVHIPAVILLFPYILKF